MKTFTVKNFLWPLSSFLYIVVCASRIVILGWWKAEATWLGAVGVARQPAYRELSG